jgi:hypothetical protein
MRRLEMAFMAVRDFECTLCQQQFSLLSGDLMPGPFFCDECLKEVWNMEDDMLEKHVEKCLVDEDESTVNRITNTIKRYRDGGGAVEEIIEQRERGRRGLLW